MLKLILLTFFGLILLSCHQQMEIDKTELRHIYSDILTADSLMERYYLIDSIENFEAKFIKQSDTTYYIATCDISKNGIWNDNLFDSLIIISKHKLHSFSKSNAFTITPSYYKFSLPYFSEDKQTFLIYYNHYCGNLCAEYSLREYKKINKTWTFIKTYFSLVS